MARLAGAIADHPWVTLCAVFVVTGLALGGIVDLRTGAPRLRLDPAVDRILPEGGEATRFNADIRRRFGSDEALTVALATNDVFTPDALTSVVRMTERFLEIDGVRRVTSLSTAPNIRSTDDELVVEPFVRDVPDDPADLERLRREVLENPIYAGNLVSLDSRATALRIQLAQAAEDDFATSGLDVRLAEIAEAERGDAQVWITGSPLLKLETSRALLSDLRMVVPAALGVAALIAALVFRSVRGVLIPISTIVIGLIWTLGAMGWCGVSLNLVTTVIPPLLLTVGFAYAVHVLSSYNAAAAKCASRSGRDVVHAALIEVSLPLLLTALTTFVGFLSLTTSSIRAVQEFGAFSALGAVATALVALTFGPAVLRLLSVPPLDTSTDGTSVLDRLFGALARFDIDVRRVIFGTAVVVVVAAAWGLTRLEVRNDFVNNFGEDVPVRTHYEAISERLGGASPFYVVLEAEERDAFKDPATLRMVDELQRWIEREPLVGGVVSLVDHVKLLNWGLHGNDPGHRTIPESLDVVDQLLFFGAGEELPSLVDGSYRTTRLLVRSRTADSAALRVLFERLETKMATLPVGMRGRVTGDLVLLSTTVDDVARGQLGSLSIAFIAIFLILAVLFASPWIGFIALIPNALPVLIYFGLMGLTGIALNTVTGLVACIVLGIAVDDSVHYLTRFSVSAREHADERRGTVEALQTVGRPVTYTTVALCLGFATLLLSSLKTQVHFGVLASLTLFAAWVIDVTLTPALCSGLRFVNLWDLLTLDLGHDPQRSIPLFAGLKRSQARVVALMTNLRTYPAGETLMRLGEGGDEMYVVIDGELVVWLDQDGRRTELVRLGRGDVVGEMALFQGHRTANVEVVVDARLISLGRRDLEVLRKRYPRIASIVYRNLGEVLARRVARTTERLLSEAHEGMPAK